MEQPDAFTDELKLQISIAAAPAVTFRKNEAGATLPGVAAQNNGFRINVEAAVPYPALSRVLNGLLADRRFEVSEGLIPMHVIVLEAAVSADAAGKLLIQVQFGGSFNGNVYFTGQPVYDAAAQTVRVANMGYNLQSKSFLLNTAKWLFSNKIESEIKKRTQFPLAPYLSTAKAAIHNMLNKEWTNGISGAGTVGDLRLEEVAALPEYLRLKCHCDGNLVIQVGNLDFVQRG
jgi:hypothetical protein